MQELQYQNECKHAKMKKKKKKNYFTADLFSSLSVHDSVLFYIFFSLQIDRSNRRFKEIYFVHVFLFIFDNNNIHSLYNYKLKKYDGG